MSVIDLSMVSAVPCKTAPKVVAIHPTGSSLLIERLTAQELTSSNIFIDDEAEVEGPPQAYILEVGPNLPESTGLKAGQRVIVQGRGVPVPNFDNNKRSRMLVEFTMIKGILDEEKCSCL